MMLTQAPAPAPCQIHGCDVYMSTYRLWGGWEGGGARWGRSVHASGKGGEVSVLEGDAGGRVGRDIWRHTAQGTHGA